MGQAYPKPIRLNLGCGTALLDKYVNIDVLTPDDDALIGFWGKKIFQNGDAIDLHEFPDNTVAEIRASHILEHYGNQDVLKALAEWRRVLEPGGLLRIAVPDFGKLARLYLDGEDRNFQGYIMGGQTTDHDYHKTLFDEDCLRETLELAGFSQIRPWDTDGLDTSALDISLNLEAVKPVASGPVPVDIDLDAMSKDIVAIMSCPRLAWMDNFKCAMENFSILGIPMRIGFGVYWDQCLTRLIEDVIAGGAKYILTLDYDTVFTVHDVGRLYHLMETTPFIDALAPIQMKRGGTLPLFTLLSPDRTMKREITTGDMIPPVIPIRSAHFGLTLFRAEMFKYLVKPWFKGIPDNDGGWNEGHVDPDCYFWQNMLVSGRNPYLSTETVIGHLEPMVTWPDRRLQAIHQYASDYNEKGKPETVWLRQQNTPSPSEPASEPGDNPPP